MSCLTSAVQMSQILDAYKIAGNGWRSFSAARTSSRHSNLVRRASCSAVCNTTAPSSFTRGTQLVAFAMFDAHLKHCSIFLSTTLPASILHSLGRAVSPGFVCVAVWCSAALPDVEQSFFHLFRVPFSVPLHWFANKDAEVLSHLHVVSWVKIQGKMEWEVTKRRMWKRKNSKTVWDLSGSYLLFWDKQDVHQEIWLLLPRALSTRKEHEWKQQLQVDWNWISNSDAESSIRMTSDVESP